MAWSKNGTTTLSSAGDTVTVSSLTATDFGMTLSHNLQSGTVRPAMKINSATSGYANRYSENGATDSTSVNRGNYLIDLTQASYDDFIILYNCGIQTEEKLFIEFYVDSNTSGAGNAPNRTEGVGKYADTSNTISSIEIFNTETSIGDWAIGSNLTALNGDTTGETILANVQSGSRFEATDTRKIYYAGGFNKSGCKAYYNFEQTGTEIAQSTANDFVNVYSSAQHSAGFKLNSASSALNGTTVNSVTFYLKKAGSPTGTAYAKIYNGTTLVETSTNSLDVSTLTTSYQAITFNFAGTTTLSNGYTVAYYYDGGDGSNYTQFNYSTTDVYDSTNTIMRRFASSAWSDITTGDAKFVLNPVLLTNIATTANGFTDGLGSSADGSITNGTVTTGVTGKVGNAWTFNGSSSKVAVNSAIISQGTADYSLSLWFNTNGFSANQEILRLQNSAGSSQYELYLHPTSGLKVYDGTNTITIETNANLSSDTWYHLVIVRSGGTDYTYLNNVAKATGSSGSISNAHTNWYIGSRLENNTEVFNGEIDELVTFNRALTADEISYLYNSGTGRTVNSTDVLGWTEEV